MDIGQQQNWANNLASAKAQIKKNQIPVEEQEKIILEEAEYYRPRLKESLEKRDHVGVEKYFGKLINLRAKQLAIVLEKIKQKNDESSAEKAIEETAKYYNDCLALLLSIDKLFGVKK